MHAVPCLAHVLIVVGGVLQIIGVGWAVIEVGKIRRSIAALRAAGRAIASEIRATLQRQAEEQIIGRGEAVLGSVSLSGSGSISASGTVGPPPTLEQRIERMESEVQRLDTQAETDREAMRVATARAREHADAIDREIRQLIDAQERQRRESEETARRLQRRIAPLLILGLALSVVGSVIPCERPASGEASGPTTSPYDPGL
jgi:outer membrane murein-binding lipoprotein Lpp